MIVGISGKARSGKDTFAMMLAEELFNLTRIKFIMMAYAHGIKVRVQRDFDLSYEQLWGDEKEIGDVRYPKATVSDSQEFWSAREIMQVYGEFYRTIYRDFWVRYLFELAEEKEYKNIIITDVRHPNEVKAISERDGYVIKVDSEREGKPKVYSTQHISETALDDYNEYDFTVNNNGGLEVLRQSAIDVAKFLLSSEKMKNNLKNLEVKNG